MGMTYQDLVLSRIWREGTVPVKIAWVTMLALVDRDWLIRGTIEEIAQAARMPEDEFRSAFEWMTIAEDKANLPGAEGVFLRTIDGITVVQVVNERHRFTEGLEGRRKRDALRKRRERAMKKYRAEIEAES